MKIVNLIFCNDLFLDEKGPSIKRRLRQGGGVSSRTSTFSLNQNNKTISETDIVRTNYNIYLCTFRRRKTLNKLDIEFENV